MILHFFLIVWFYDKEINVTVTMIKSMTATSKAEFTTKNIISNKLKEKNRA